MVMSDNLRLPGGGYAPASPRCTQTAAETLPLRRECATCGYHLHS